MTGLRTAVAKLVAGCVAGIACALPIAALMGGGAASAYGPTPTTTTPTTQPVASATTVAPAQASQPAKARSGGLAFTGADITGSILAGAIAIGGGGTLVLASRNRRQHRPDS